MSLYNMVRGFNPNASLCLAMLKIAPNTVARFRDAWLSDDGKTIVLLTRTGGGNRDDYEDDNERLHTVPGFVSDEDDDFDSTFARFTYLVPKEYQNDAATIAALMTAVGKGAEGQGPGAIIAALEPQPAKPKVETGDPRVAAAQAAYDRLVAILAPAD